MQAARDHQMQDEPKVVLEADANALSEPTQTQDLFSDGAVERRGRGAQEKRTHDPDGFERLAENAPLKRFDVNDDVGQFGHAWLAMMRRTIVQRRVDPKRLNGKREHRSKDRPLQDKAAS